MGGFLFAGLGFLNGCFFLLLFLGFLNVFLSIVPRVSSWAELILFPGFLYGRVYVIVTRAS